MQGRKQIGVSVAVENFDYACEHRPHGRESPIRALCWVKVRISLNEACS